jgi:hypothetical protein
MKVHGCVRKFRQSVFRSLLRYSGGGLERGFGEENSKVEGFNGSRA